jgi:hypothetical protein
MMPPPTMTIDLGEVAASAAAEEDDVMGDILVVARVVSDVRTNEGVVGDVVVARHRVVDVVVLSLNLLIKTLQRERSIGRLRELLLPKICSSEAYLPNNSPHKSISASPPSPLLRVPQVPQVALLNRSSCTSL